MACITLMRHRQCMLGKQATRSPELASGSMIHLTHAQRIESRACCDVFGVGQE